MIRAQSQLKEQISSGSNRQIKEVKITFRFLHTNIQGGDKIAYIFAPSAKLLQVKKKLDEQTKKNFTFYIRDSFIPSLDTRIGDIAFCYGRKQSQSKYEISLSASENPYQFG